MRNTFWFCFWLVAGLLFGGLLAGVCSGIPILSWLAYTQSISVSPAADLISLDFAIYASFSLNIAQVICVVVAMVCYRHFN